MERISAWASGLLIFLFLWSLPGRAQVPQEKPQGYINDFAGVLSPAVRRQLESLATELDQKTGAQMAVVTVQSLEGESLEIFVNDLATRWGVGDQKDRGILLFLAIQDRRSRIEVGYGLEPIITDGRSGSILRAMTPHLQNGDYNSAIVLGVASLAQIIAQDAGVTLAVGPPAPAGGTRSRTGVSPRGGLGRFLPLFFILPFLLFRRRRGRYGGGWYGMPLYGGGMMGRGLGGFSGGGGFGGFGGGGFGGGGSSGSW